MDKVDVRWGMNKKASERARAKRGEKVINFVTPDSICSASLPIPHIRQCASVKLFDAVAVKASVPHAAKLKSDPRLDLIALADCREPARAIRYFGRGIHLNSIKPLLRRALSIFQF